MSANARRLTLVLLSALLATAGSAAASNIYKWTDEQGNVHYGDKPAPDASAERLAIESRSTDQAAVASLVDARREAREATRQQEADAASETESPEEQRQAAAERAEQCTKFRERLQQYVQSRRLYKQDENGERVYLDEEEMIAARNKVQQQVQEYCNN